MFFSLLLYLLKVLRSYYRHKAQEIFWGYIITVYEFANLFYYNIIYHYILFIIILIMIWFFVVCVVLSFYNNSDNSKSILVFFMKEEVEETAQVIQGRYNYRKEH